MLYLWCHEEGRDWKFWSFIALALGLILFAHSFVIQAVLLWLIFLSIAPKRRVQPEKQAR